MIDFLNTKKIFFWGKLNLHRTFETGCMGNYLCPYMQPNEHVMIEHTQYTVYWISRIKCVCAQNKPDACSTTHRRFVTPINRAWGCQVGLHVSASWHSGHCHSRPNSRVRSAVEGPVFIIVVCGTCRPNPPRIKRDCTILTCSAFLHFSFLLLKSSYIRDVGYQEHAEIIYESYNRQVIIFRCRGYPSICNYFMNLTVENNG
jgi:hypothetical protein